MFRCMSSTNCRSLLDVVLASISLCTACSSLCTVLTPTTGQASNFGFRSYAAIMVLWFLLQSQITTNPQPQIFVAKQKKNGVAWHVASVTHACTHAYPCSAEADMHLFRMIDAFTCISMPCMHMRCRGTRPFSNRASQPATAQKFAKCSRALHE